MDTFLYPSTIAYAAGSPPHTATLTVEPLFHGYGTTIGNTLRRTLLSSLQGGALTAVRISVMLALESTAIPIETGMS